MARAPKTQVTYSLPVDLIDLLDNYATTIGMPKVQIVEVALRRFLTAEMAKLNAKDPAET